ncbi:GSU2403 family nucleotidyltransferase fold protein [Paraburkholderia strydomiana]|uniref:GSU2403 family nucleotidyltransferase fold protein n=1 Tax=Paraburkholderia strydomiana TaxID=1245417 RepID=UPI0038B93FDE
MRELTHFSRLAETLMPWRQQIVFVGGWAFRLYQYAPRAYKPDFGAIFTQDADVAYAPRAPLEGDIKAALLGAGFSEEPNFSGDFKPPAMRYTLADADGFYAEFLTPLGGSSGWKRGKNPGERVRDATAINAGVVAQKLPHLEVLLHEPWLVTIPAEDSGLGEPVVGIQVPNPVSFMIQKILIRDDRDPRKRAQDVLYIHDALITFGAMIEDELGPAWKELERTLTSQQQKSVYTGVEALFGDVNDLIREAAGIPAGDRPNMDPAALLAVCQEGFGELFG